MRKILILLISMLLIGCHQIQSETGVELSSDKDLYRSGEMINLTTTVDMPVEAYNITVKFYGIHASRYRLKKEKQVDLKQGINEVNLNYKAPSCYGCAGIKPGTYQITTEVIYENKTLGNSSIDIEIRQ